MISKIIKGTGMEGVVSYAMDGDHRVIIGGNLAGRTPRQLSKEFGQFRKLRPSLERAVAHLMLSAAPEDPPLDAQAWNRIGDIFLKDLGYQSCPHVIFRHNDMDNDHIHIACLRIGPDGKTVPDGNDRFKAERSLARIEEQFGLRRVNLVKKRRSKLRKGTPTVPEFIQSVVQAIPTTTKEEEMKNEEITGTEGEIEAPMPELLNIGDDLSEHVFGHVHAATVMTAMAGDDPNERQRREFKRVIRNPEYDQMVKHLLDPDVSHIFHHQRGSVIYLARPERIADDGDRLTAHNMEHSRAARAIVALACSRGWTSIVFDGPTDFLIAAMTEAIAQGIPVHARNAGHRAILDRIMAGSNGACGTVAAPMAFQPPVPPIPHAPLLEPAKGPQPAQQVPSAPVVPPIELNTNLASKLGQRRQSSPPDQQPNVRGPMRP
jgi:hypothetical protein